MADIGTTLREARIRARIDISEVEARTKIRAKYLRAIENEEWDLLPGPVYVKSFLRTYGEFLGLDSRQLVDEFKRRYERPSDQELRPISARQRERQRRPRRRTRLGRLGAVVIVLAAVVAALFLVGSLSSKNTPTTPTAPTTAATGAHSSTTSSTRAATAPPAHHVHHAPPKPTTVTLKLVPTSAVYVCVVNGAGQKLIDGVTFSAGESVPVETAHKLMITLGNGGVQMQVDGKPVTLAPGSPIGYELTPGKTTVLAAGQLPTCA
ncbi:MAG: helix-turn-helix domain-containing protein [Solirubrobacteraceae bacterium]